MRKIFFIITLRYGPHHSETTSSLSAELETSLKGSELHRYIAGELVQEKDPSIPRDAVTLFYYLEELEG